MPSFLCARPLAPFFAASFAGALGCLAVGCGSTNDISAAAGGAAADGGAAGILSAGGAAGGAEAGSAGASSAGAGGAGASGAGGSPASKGGSAGSSGASAMIGAGGAASGGAGSGGASGAGPAAGAGGAGGGGSAGAGSWAPPLLPGLSLWLDASLVTAAADGHVSDWPDRSPHHNDGASKAPHQPLLLPAAQGIHALPVVRFERARQTVVTLADSPSLQWGTKGFTIAAVVAYSTPVVGPGLCHLGGLGVLFEKPHPSGAKVEIGFHLNFPTHELPNKQCTPDDPILQVGTGETSPGLDSPPGGPPYNDNVARLYLASLDTSSGKEVFELRVNGVSVATKSTKIAPLDLSLPGQNVTVGANGNQHFGIDGDVAELLATEGALPAADLALLEGYLRQKYALP